MQKMPVGILGVASLLAIAGHAQAAPKTAKQVIADQYICVFKPSITQPNVQAQANRVVGAQNGNLLRTYRHSIRGFAAHMSAQAVARIDKVNSGIAFCEQDQVASASQVATAKPGSGGGSVQPAQTIPWGVKLVGGGITTSPALAWVIDSGIDLTHPDLNVNKTGNISFTRDSSPNDGNGHGTHVAGIIAACNNSIGVVGVAPCTAVVSVRVLDRTGRGSVSDVIAGIDYVAQYGHAGDVANLSLGAGASDALDAAVINAAAAHGVKFTIAAGNSSDNANNYSPARANGPGVYTVSAFDSSRNFASFSNFGNPPIDFSEPGVSIYSTTKGGSYVTLSGTSMAAPHLAGLLLLGNANNGGPVQNDPDGTADIIGIH